MQKVGNEGVITVEAKALDTEVEIVEGMQFDRGYLSPYFITNAEKMVAELETPILLQKKLSGLQAMLPVLEAVVQTGKPLQSSPKTSRASAHCGQQAARRAPCRRRQGAGLRRPPQGHARRHRDLTAGQLISEDLGIKLENVTIDARAPEGDHRRKTTIVAGADQKEIEARVGQIKAQIEGPSDYDKEKLQERLAKLAGGVAVIRVGGATEVGSRRRRTASRTRSTRAAVEEGIVPGGGVALLRARRRSDGSPTTTRMSRLASTSCSRRWRRRSAKSRRIPASRLDRGRRSSSKSETFGFDAQTRHVGGQRTTDKPRSCARGRMQPRSRACW